jgi:hypothetical protein
VLVAPADPARRPIVHVHFIHRPHEVGEVQRPVLRVVELDRHVRPHLVRLAPGVRKWSFHLPNRHDAAAPQEALLQRLGEHEDVRVVVELVKTRSNPLRRPAAT